VWEYGRCGKEVKMKGDRLELKSSGRKCRECGVLNIKPEYVGADDWGGD
jgi:hypothetical protein